MTLGRAYGQVQKRYSEYAGLSTDTKPVNDDFSKAPTTVHVIWSMIGF